MPCINKLYFACVCRTEATTPRWPAASGSMACDHGDVYLECSHLHCPLHDRTFRAERSSVVSAIVRIETVNSCVQKILSNKLASFHRDHRVR